MTQPAEESDPVTMPPGKNEADLPRPIIKKRRWTSWLVWLVPAAAAVMAGWYLVQEIAMRGPEVVIVFEDSEGIMAGQTKVECHGVEIGEVTGVTLSKDEQHARVGVRLTKAASDFGNEGSKFWVVKPEISGAEFHGLNTVVSGPYIEGISGAGGPAKEFHGLLRSPVEEGGLKIVVQAEKTEHLSAESPVYYRGIQVGKVLAVELAEDATHVNMRVAIEEKYRNLIRNNTVFWNSTGADVKGGLFTGLQVKVDSLKSLIAGGLSFATPDNPIGAPAAEGATYLMADEAKKEWDKWAPMLPVGAGDAVKH